MKKLFAIMALALLLMPAVAFAQPAGCTWDGDPYLRYGFGAAPTGIDVASTYPGDVLEYTLAPYNAALTDLPAGCKATDTLCFHISSAKGWPITCDPAMGDLYELLPGYLFYQNVSIEIPCGTAVGIVDTIIAVAAYSNLAGVCAPECGDCNDPNIRATGTYYNADTLIVTVIAPPPMLGVYQDTLTLVDRGQTAAYIPFTLCNQDVCADNTNYKYTITSPGIPGRIPAINTGLLSLGIVGGNCKDVYAVLDASLALVCDYADLTIIVYTTQIQPTLYDTCVQRVHIVEPVPVPLFTAPVVTILVLALILVAAVFMRRRAVSRA